MKCLRRFFIGAVMCVMIVAFSGGDLFAQNRAGAFNVTPRAGAYVFDGSQELDNGPLFGFGFGYDYTENIGVEAVFDFVDTESKLSGVEEEAYIYRIDGLYHFMPRNRLVPYVSGGLGAITLDDDQQGTDTDGLFDYGAGIKYFISQSAALRGEVRHVMDFDDTRSNFMGVLGVTLLLGKKEEPVKEKAPALSISRADSDGDGVYDSVDRCPGTPAGVEVDSLGCPYDTDRDGVYDYLDDCPKTPGGTTVDIKGCPLDSDGDGVMDGEDRCPGTPAAAPVDSDGCPLDSDNDGVYDYRDQCPGTLEGIKVDNAGCPVPIREKVSIELNVEFQHNSAVVKNMYHDHIQKVANFLETYPDAKAVIEGHTDSTGPQEYNLKLSRRRAENVVQHLVDDGINPDRLEAVGYGESRPVADNSTEEGRQRNRRVVAVISTVVTK